MKSMDAGTRGLFIKHKRDGSIHLRRKGTVIFAWFAILSLSPFLTLFGLAEVEEYGFRGVGVHLATGLIFAIIIRGAIRCRVVLLPDGSLRDVGPFVETTFSEQGALSAKSDNNGLVIVHSGREHGIWAFSQSVIGGRSARSARNYVDAWSKEGHGQLVGSAGARIEKKAYIRPADVFLLVVPFVVPLLMKF